MKYFFFFFFWGGGGGGGVFTEKRVNFLFIFFVKGKTKLFFRVIFVNFARLSAVSGYNIGCKPSLHLENGLSCHFNRVDKKKFAVKEIRLNCRRTDVACNLALRELKSDVKM